MREFSEGFEEEGRGGQRSEWLKGVYGVQGVNGLGQKDWRDLVDG